MGDVGDVYREWKEHRREQKEKALAETDSTGWKKHTDYHWYRYIHGKKLDYWPSTGKFQYNNKVYQYGDINLFIKELETKQLALERLDESHIMVLDPCPHKIKETSYAYDDPVRITDTREPTDDDGECPF